MLENLSIAPRGMALVTGWVLACALGFMAVSYAQEAGEKTFATAQDASKTLSEAVKSNDSNAILQVLGDASVKVLSSGDSVADKNNCTQFVERYEQMNRLSLEGDGSQTLIIGADNWPLPIPLRQNTAGQWYFDTKSGLEEILYRRIGSNEYAAMRVLAALYDAQKEYFGQAHDGDPVHQYAQKLFSSPGKQDGLYWKTAESDPKSPIGPLVAYATGEGYGGKSDKEQPFHGYFYRILTGQVNAKGETSSFLVDGKMTAGFATLAFSAEYRNSGVMAFVIDDKGIMHEKDLGEKTTDIANSLKVFNPKGWRIVTPEQGEDDNGN